MSRPLKPALPLREGVSASAVFCPAGPWPTVLDFLSERLPLVTRTQWRARLGRGEVVGADGEAVASDAPAPAGQRLYYWRQLEVEPEIPFHEQVVFEDEHVLVADKPHFLPVTPGGRYVQQTLLARLRRRTGLADLSPIHRIDRETAGLVAFSKRPAERDAYQALFRHREVEKLYECIAADAAGQPWPQLLSHRLTEREGDAFMQMQTVSGEPNARTWVTRVDALADGLARYELRPITGVKHQLRAQMSALGLPILGDRIYPELQPFEDPPRFDAPLRLVARELRFTDPITGQLRHFCSDAKASL